MSFGLLCYEYRHMYTGVDGNNSVEETVSAYRSVSMSSDVSEGVNNVVCVATRFHAGLEAPTSTTVEMV